MLRIALIASLFAFISCDRHEWEGPEGTSRLFKGHGSHDSHADDAHGDDSHAKDGHADKKDAAAH